MGHKEIKEWLDAKRGAEKLSHREAIERAWRHETIESPDEIVLLCEHMVVRTLPGSPEFRLAEKLLKSANNIATHTKIRQQRGTR